MVLLLRLVDLATIIFSLFIWLHLFRSGYVFVRTASCCRVSYVFVLESLRLIDWKHPHKTTSGTIRTLTSSCQLRSDESCRSCRICERKFHALRFLWWFCVSYKDDDRIWCSKALQHSERLHQRTSFLEFSSGGKFSQHLCESQRHEIVSKGHGYSSSACST